MAGLPAWLTPVLTRDNMMRSLRARVSPCFILMRFLSRHFMAYLVGMGWWSDSPQAPVVQSPGLLWGPGSGWGPPQRGLGKD